MEPSDCVRIVHFTRRLLGLVGATKRAAPGAGLRTVFAAQSLEEARRLARELGDDWRPSHPHIATQIDEHIEDCFACYAFPPSHRVRTRTTNGVERLNEKRNLCARLHPALARGG